MCSKSSPCFVTKMMNKQTYNPMHSFIVLTDGCEFVFVALSKLKINLLTIKNWQTPIYLKMSNNFDNKYFFK